MMNDSNLSRLRISFTMESGRIASISCMIRMSPLEIRLKFFSFSSKRSKLMIWPLSEAAAADALGCCGFIFSLEFDVEITLVSSEFGSPFIQNEMCLLVIYLFYNHKNQQLSVRGYFSIPNPLSR
jgi:hypothetical protein